MAAKVEEIKSAVYPESVRSGMSSQGGRNAERSRMHVEKRERLNHTTNLEANNQKENTPALPDS